ncbi:hypothetical protein BKA62DRAFT_630494 [Auriculariales sp. MPI-PUGE-AT-0066]|nr:hypothetical protein BKA62DRAFT_630494 [Auriculariales sp. MPI-PUGE-AT-0066]
MAWHDDLLLKVTNIVVFVLFLGSNLYAANPEDVYRLHRETYFTPDSFAYLLWTLIHVLLAGLILYQWFPSGSRTIIHGISWRFPLLAILNAIYSHVKGRGHYVVAFILSLLVGSAVSNIYYVIKRYHRSESLNDEVWIHLPFGLYHGWATVMIVLSGFEAFGINAVTRKPGIWTDVFVFLSLLFLQSTSAAYSFGSSEGDLSGSVAITWVLFAIFNHQHTPFIHWSALAFAVLSSLWVLKSAYEAFFVRRAEAAAGTDNEREPLNGARASV